ncbi:MAG: pentapeptide repeat-containing protein, partial [Planctomycetes bacterium]|nr:pentapeptide repeat-containing protein [Planctomycetota bacterium]
DPAQPAPEGPAAVCAVFANLLDRLSPWAIETLQALESGSLDGEAVETLLLGATTPDPVEACELFEVDGRLARQIATSRAGPIRGWRNLTDVRFALPRLPDFLQAGNCLQKIARSVVPRPISPSWFPYLCELITPAHRDELRGWLEAETPHGDSAAATILWATGETPNLEGPRKRNLSDAVLPGVPLAGVKLPRANLRRANLERAHLEGASLEEIFAPGLSASFANFSGANLSSANLRSADLRGARFSGVTAEGAVFDCATLTGACLEGAFLRNASFSDAFLEGADLTRADLTLASLRALVLSGTNFQWANLTQANLRRCDLRWADLSGANLSGAIFQGCALSAVELDELAISQSGFFASELSGTTFRDADLHEAYFTHCWAHEANFEGADLRNSIFEEVTFHAGSSRSGLLLGGPASEGTRTGYYEGTNDDAWSPPESVRQASFCGADLRGASFRSTDLFRVDFRDALLDPELRTQAEQAGAIL